MHAFDPRQIVLEATGRRAYADIVRNAPIQPKPNPTAIPMHPVPRNRTDQRLFRGTAGVNSAGRTVDAEWLREVTQALGPEAAQQIHQELLSQSNGLRRV